MSAARKVYGLNMWAPVSPSGLIVVRFADTTRRDAIENIRDDENQWRQEAVEWADLKAKGWQVIRIRVEPHP